MKFQKTAALLLSAATLLLALTGCAEKPQTETDAPDTQQPTEVQPTDAPSAEITDITLSDDGVTCGSDDVYTANDIIYYEDGHDESYGKGSAADAHSAEEAAAHTVVHITAAGTYRITGKLSAGQIFVDLGENAAQDPNAVVTLILDNADITCTVAPAVFFYRVYECGDESAVSASAGARVQLADGSVNNVDGSYVARIYREGTTEKLHKYDGAFYSRMSMVIEGSDGALNITAANEGLDSEMHLNIDGGVIAIESQDDGINTNEDGVSVTTINGGSLTIRAGLGAEGDGIDSNGKLIINGGSVYTTANEQSPDGGIDADGDILLNGGTLIACGTRNDAVSADSAQPYMELSFASTVAAGSTVALSSADGELFSFTTERALMSLTLSDPSLAENVPYTLTVNGVVQQYTGTASGGMMGGMPDNMGSGREGFELPDGFAEWLENAELPENIRTWLESFVDRLDGMGENGDRDDRQPPEMELPDGQPPVMPNDTPNDMPNDMPNGLQQPDRRENDNAAPQTASTQFTLTQDVHSFSGIGDSAEGAGKIAVEFQFRAQPDWTAVLAEGKLSELLTLTAEGEPLSELPELQLTVTDVPSEDFAETALLSDGVDALAKLLPEDAGTYRLTIAVVSDRYTGVYSADFTIAEE